MKRENNFRIALYIRVSTEEQAENPEGSIRNQEERLLQTIKLKNMEGNFGEAVGTFIDRARSGKDTNRPELQKLLQMIRNKKVDLVMCSELSRISRNMRDFAEIWEMMKRSGCAFYSLRENFDTTTAAGEMVLYTVANIAQFERRQVSERVAANMNARASRGLYNGGSIPIGYKKNPDKPGTLEIDKENAKLVQTIFDTFLREGSLSQTAKWLNRHNYKLPKKIEGGGSKMRLDFFTVDNVHHILKNKVYVALRQYRESGKVKDAQAVWEPIVDKALFDQVQEKIVANCSAKKPMDAPDRWPYVLTGIVRCATCGNPMVGKSAHGKNEKIGYYEHSWATKKNSTLTSKIFQCDPHRVLAKKLEPFVFERVRALLGSEKLASELIQEANAAFEKGSPKKEVERLKASIYGYNSQLEGLAERLGQLPKSVSPKPLFTQMEKLEAFKREAEEKIREIESSSGVLERPAGLVDFKSFLASLRTIFETTASNEIKSEIIKRVIAEIEVGPNFVRLHYLVGEPEEASILGIQGGAESKCEIAETKKGHPLDDLSSVAPSEHGCSNSLTFGAGGGT